MATTRRPLTDMSCNSITGVAGNRFSPLIGLGAAPESAANGCRPVRARPLTQFVGRRDVSRTVMPRRRFHELKRLFGMYGRDTHLPVGAQLRPRDLEVRFRAEGVQIERLRRRFGQADLRKLLGSELVAKWLGVGKEETLTRAEEVSRLTWALATVYGLPGMDGKPHGPCLLLIDVCTQGLRLMTLDAKELISRFKDFSTKLVQFGVMDLSPAAVSGNDVMSALRRFFFPPRCLTQMLRRARQEPSWAVGIQQTKRASAPMREETKKASLDKHLLLISQEQDLDFLPVLAEVRRTVQEIVRERPAWRLRRSPLPVFPSTSASFESTRKDGGAFGYFSRLYGTGRVPGMVPSGELMCRRVGIVEPMKLRVISAGTAEHYNRVSGFQASLWGLLRGHPTFQLIHGPLTKGHVRRFWKANRRLFGSGALALSGDYSAATDNLHPRLSEAVLDELLNHTDEEFDPSDANLLKACLTGHLILDPVGKGEVPDPAKATPQRWGQLMGSPISFPILCIINAAVCRAAVEKQIPTGRKLSLRETGILINGDDCLVPVRERSGYHTWAALAAAAGLNPSPGKCFLTRRFAQLNSQLYEGDGGRYRPFVRVNLLWDLVTKGLQAGITPMGRPENIVSLGDRLVALISRDFPHQQRNALRALARRVNLTGIEASRPIPLHLHRDFGGLGVPYLKPRKGRSWRIGPFQRKLVAWIASDPAASQSFKDSVAMLRDRVSGNPSHAALVSANERWVRTSSTQFCVWSPKSDKRSAATPSLSLCLGMAHDDESTESESAWDFQLALTRLVRFWQKTYRIINKIPVPDWRESWVPELARNGLEVEPLRVISTESSNPWSDGGDTIGWCRTLPEHRAFVLEH